MPKNNPPEDHYFLPVFYLSRWQRDEAPIVEFALRGNGKIEGRTCYPRGTAYKPRLYSNEFEPNGAKAQALETEFMQDLDRKAAETLELFDKKSTWTNEEGSNWSRFVWSCCFAYLKRLRNLGGVTLNFSKRSHHPTKIGIQKCAWKVCPRRLSNF